MAKLVSLLVLAYLWVWTSWSYIPTMAINSLKPGDLLNTSSELQSENGRYFMVFKQISLASSFTYLQIYDANAPSSTPNFVIWVANPNEHISNDSSPVLTLDHSGELKITRQGNEPIILYSPPQAFNNTVATLLNNSNFVLQELHPNGSTKQLLWQSFDYPNDILMAGMKLGVNHKTGHSWSLTSFSNIFEPSLASPFTLEWEPKGELSIRKQGQVYWKSGVLNRNNRFENVSEEAQIGYEYTIISNENEYCFSYSYTNQNSDKDFVVWYLSYDGDLYDQNKSYIARASKCYGYNTDGGCQRWSLPSCRYEGQVFVALTGYFNGSKGRVDSNTSLGLSDCRAICWSKCDYDDCVGYMSMFKNDTGCVFYYRNSSGSFIDDDDEAFYYILKPFKVEPKVVEHKDSNTSLGLSDCRAICWSKCDYDDCVGYTSMFKNDTGCVFYYRNSSGSFIDDDDEAFYYILKPFKVEPKVVEHKGTETWIWKVAVVGALFIFCTGIIYLVQKRLKVQKKTTRNAVLDLVTFYGSEDADELQKDKKNGHDLKVFSYAFVLAATNSFSSKNKLGKGGFGPVYKGKLKAGKEVAVKRLLRSSREGTTEFKNEVTLVSELQHMNLVQLLGCCIDGEEKILIYEYMPNKSLDFILFDSCQSKLLNWEKRFNIIEGVTQGLLYLHKYSRLKIVHRDLKASNILLDENMNPKISDFGLARILTEESGGNTIRIVGTYGYMALEYVMKGAFSIKSDIYSFGIVILEIVSSRRNNSFYDPNCPLNVVGYVWDLWKEGKGLELVDQSINDSFLADQVLRCIHVALLCVEEHPVDRPTMPDILLMLKNESAVLPLPNRPAVYFGRMTNVAKESLEKSKIISINDLSISGLQGR